MKQLFEGTYQISKRDPNGAILANHLCKLFEESGEFAQALNKLIGVKDCKTTDTVESIVDNIAEEAADQIQCIFLLCKLSGVSYEMIKEKLEEKNQDYLAYIEKKKQ